MVARLALIATLLLAPLGGCIKHANPAGGLFTGAIATKPAPPPHGPTKLFSWLPSYPPAQAGQVIPAGTPYTLDSGDKLRITVFGEQNLSRSYSVDGSGYISMPLIGAVMARGVTTYELERRIADELKHKYVKDPKVTVEVETYRPFFILGEVKKPGQYPYVNGMTVQTAVAIGGGFTERAKKRAVQITRRISGQPVTFNAPDNAPVRPGDTVNVMERFF